VNNVALAEAHFRERCREREIPLSVERIRHMMTRMRPCWRRTDRRRVIVSVRFGRGLLARVVWDDEIGAPVTAWWHSRDAADEHPVRDSGRGGGNSWRHAA